MGTCALYQRRIGLFLRRNPTSKFIKKLIRFILDLKVETTSEYPQPPYCLLIVSPQETG